ncbi:pyridoxamine 5'-phosphate oxidase family protein [Corynebacterium freneyi]
MALIDESMREMLSEQLPILATVTVGERPNVGPKRSLRAYGDDALIYNENTGGQHLENIRAGSPVAVAVIDRPNLDGYRFLGRAELHDDGPAWDDCLAFAAANGMGEPKHAVVIHIEEVHSLRSGPKAGTRVDGER